MHAVGVHGFALRAITVCFFGGAYFSRFPQIAELSVALGVIGALYGVVSYPRLARPSVWAMFFLMFWSAECILALSYPSLGGIAAWLNLDGVLLVALLPFLLFTNASPTAGDLGFLRQLLRVVVWGSALLYVFALAGLPFTSGVIQDHLFFGYASSHHVMGYALGTSLLGLAMWPAGKRSWSWSLDVLLAGTMCLATGSRTTLLGLGIAVAWVFLRRARGTTRLRIAFVAVCIGALLTVFVPRIAATASLVDRGGVRSTVALFGQGIAKTSIDQLPRDHEGIEAVANAKNRFALYGFSVGRWLASPLLGIGSGRFNDENTSYKGFEGVVQFATSGKDVPEGYPSAHNSYLQVLAENGIVGLCLLLGVYVSLYRELQARGTAVARLAQALVVFMLGTALTGATLQAAGLTLTAGVIALVLLGASTKEGYAERRLTTAER